MRLAAWGATVDAPAAAHDGEIACDACGCVGELHTEIDLTAEQTRVTVTCAACGHSAPRQIRTAPTRGVPSRAEPSGGGHGVRSLGAFAFSTARMDGKP